MSIQCSECVPPMTQACDTVRFRTLPSERSLLGTRYSNCKSCVRVVTIPGVSDIHPTCRSRWLTYTHLMSMRDIYDYKIHDPVPPAICILLFLGISVIHDLLVFLLVRGYLHRTDIPTGTPSMLNALPYTKLVLRIISLDESK